MSMNPPSVVAHKRMKFVIIDAPTDDNLPAYLEELEKEGVTHLVRVCEPTYDTAPLKEAGITVLEMPFADGDGPPDEIVITWLKLIEINFSKKGNGGAIAVHCVAGLGRAPVLVALALIENGMDPLEAVTKIREVRRGAINTKQLKFVEEYKPKKGCAIM